MKLKILPPTLREKKRYVALELYSGAMMENDEIINLLWNSILDIYGEVDSSRINLWVINIKRIYNEKRYQYNCIIKCRRGFEKEVITAFNTITSYDGHKVVVHTLSTSGTIKSLSDKFDLL